MPPSRFNRTSWPESGAHRELLEFLDATHRRFGCPSLREVGSRMHLSRARVHDIVRGVSLPVSEEQTRSLVLALTGRDDDETAGIAGEAEELFLKARRARDEHDPAAPETTAAEVVAPPTAPPPHRRAAVLAAAIGSVVVLAVTIGAWVLTRSPSSAAEKEAGGIVLQDTFDGTQLDATKWTAPTRGDLIFPGDGDLNFVVGPTDTKNGAEARLEPRDLDGFREMSFVVGVPEETKAGPGGPSILLRETDGRSHRFIFGPGVVSPTEQTSIVAALICSKPNPDNCHNYDDYDPPGQYVTFKPGEQIPVRIVQGSDGRVSFYARDQLFAQGPAGDAPLKNFAFDLYGAKSEAWHCTVGSIIVSR